MGGTERLAGETDKRQAGRQTGCPGLGWADGRPGKQPKLPSLAAAGVVDALVSLVGALAGGRAPHFKRMSRDEPFRRPIRRLDRPAENVSVWCVHHEVARSGTGNYAQFVASVTEITVTC
jgi:hypothetical protein